MSLLHGVGAGLGGSGDAGGPLGSFYSHTIDQSLRLNGSNKSLSRTVGSSVTNRKKFTISGWVKPTFSTGLTSTASAHMWAGYGKNGGNYGQLGFYADDLYYYDYNNACYLRSTALFRDRSAWYHIVLIVDTTQSTAADRNIVYVNGTQITAWDTQTNYSLNHDTNYNVADSATNHFVGSSGATNGSPYQWFEGYIAEFHFVDGTAVAISNWGETKDGVWVAKEYSGSHGDNGYYLPFDDTSAIGDDESANTNDFTSNNLAASDVVKDSPTNNFPTMNSLVTVGKGQSIFGAFTEGNLKVRNTASNYSQAIATHGVQTGKYYYECYVNEAGYPSWMIGWMVAGMNGLNNVEFPTNAGAADAEQASFTGFGYFTGSNVYISDWGDTSSGISTQQFAHSGAHSAGDAPTTGDIIGVAADFDNRKLYWHINGEYINSGSGTSNPSTGANANSTYTASEAPDANHKFPWLMGYGTSSFVFNFGQDDSFAGNKTSGSAAASDDDGIGEFYYAVPTGFKAICATQMADITIGPGQSSQSDDNFNTVLYTGNNTDDTGITGVGFQPDWTWIKRRDGTAGSQLYDSVRGATKRLQANKNTDESTEATGLKSFDSDGFTLGTLGGSNGNTETFVAWNWKAGGSASTISADSISSGVPANASSVSVNTDADFSIISYTGTGSTTTFGHGLGVQPEAMFIKNRDADRGWFLLTKAFQTKYFSLEGTGSGQTGYYLSSNTFDDRMTATLMTVDGSTTETNTNGEKYICYAFAGVEGYSKFGSFAGNSAADGTFVYLGFRPAYVILKRDSNGVDWSYFDNKRLGFNVDNNNLRASADAGPGEQTDDDIDFLSNGFKCRRNFANNQGTVLFLAWAEAPFKFSNAR